jgi:hypothetical protein
MQLILAIDSDPRRSEQLASLVRAKLQVDLVQAKSAGEGLLALQDRIPDLILTAPLLSPFDEGVLDEYLRDLGAAGAHVQTVRIPVLNAEPKRSTFANRLFVLGGGGRSKPSASAATPDGCDPGVFADEISTYLSRAASAKPTIAHMAQALSRHEEAMSRPQELVPPAPPVVNPVGAITDEYIAQFNDAIVLTDPQVVEPQYVAPTEPLPIEAIEPTHGMVSEPTLIDRSPSSFDDVSRLGGEHIIEAMRTPEPLTRPEPEPTRPTRDKSDTFEAALAAIRAAWTKPDPAPVAESSSGGSAASRSAAHNEVPLVREVENPTTRSVTTRGKTAPDRRQMPDEWGMFDAEKCGFPALVEKLDEVAESKDTTQRKLGTSTVISIR